MADSEPADHHEPAHVDLLDLIDITIEAYGTIVNPTDTED